MAHVKKYAHKALAPMLAHYDRSRAANRDIDSTRTCQNYNLAPDRGDLLNFIDDFCCSIKCEKRDDIIKLCDWVVTMPKDLDPSKESIFFSSTYNFLVNRYGMRQNDNNIVGAFVHKDESMSHMHFCFVPVTTEKKNKKKLGQWKVCASDVIDKLDLATFHGDLQDYLEKELGCPVHILNEATKDGNRSIADLKRDSQRTESHIDLLQRMEKDVERTKMGKGGIYGAEAIKMRVEDFDMLMQMARSCSAEYTKAKKLQDKRDANADAQARADELAKELLHERELVTRYKQQLDEQIEYTTTYGKQQYNKGYDKGKTDYKYDNERIIKNGKLIDNALNYPDLIDSINNIIHTAQARDAERKQVKSKQRYTGR